MRLHVSNLLLLFYKSLHNFGKRFKFFRVKLFQVSDHPAQGFRVVCIDIKKFLWRDVEVFADIEKVFHRGKVFPIFNAIDISRILSNRQAHVPSRHTSLRAKLC